MTLILLAAAYADAERAAELYEEQRPGAGAKFRRTVAAVMDQIEAQPFLFPRWPRARRDLRRALVHGYPFAIAYIVLKSEIIVLAVAHTRRRPRFWLSRLPH